MQLNNYSHNKIYFTEKFSQKILSLKSEGINIENEFHIEKWLINEIERNPYGNININPIILQHTDCLLLDIDNKTNLFCNNNTKLLKNIQMNDNKNKDTKKPIYDIVKHLLYYPSRKIYFEYIYQTLCQYYSYQMNKSDLKKVLEDIGYSEYNNIILPTLSLPLKEWRKEYAETILSDYKNVLFLSQMKFHLQPPKISDNCYQIESKDNILYLIAGISYQGLTTIIIYDNEDYNDEEIYIGNVITKLSLSINNLFPLSRCKLVLDINHLDYSNILEDKLSKLCDKVIIQPFGSIDCNPMEYIWNLIDKRIKESFSINTNINTIIRNIRLIWADIRFNMKLLNKLMKSTEGNLNYIKHKGQYIKNLCI